MKATERQANPKREGEGVDVSTHTQKDVHAVFCEASIKERICKDLEARIEEGKKEYGERLTTNNNRDCIQDAYQEALDLLHYLTQALLEGKISGNDYAWLFPTAFRSARFLRIRLDQVLEDV